MLTIANDVGTTFLASDTNSYSGGTTINSNAGGNGFLSIGAGGATGNLPAGDVYFNSATSTGGRLYFFKSTDMTVPNNLKSVNGTGGIVLQIGAGTTTLTGNNTTYQATFVGGGRLKADFSGGTSPISSGSGLSINGGAFEYVGPAGDNQFRMQALALGAFTGPPASFNGGLVGDSIVQSTYGGSGTQSLIFNGLSRANAGSTVSFITSGGVNGVTNSIQFVAGGTVGTPMGGAFYFNGADFAFLDRSGAFVRAANFGVDPGTTLNGLSGYSKLTNSALTAQATVAVPAVELSGATANLTMAAAGVLPLNANPGAVLKSGGGTSTIAGGAGA